MSDRDATQREVDPATGGRDDNVVPGDPPVAQDHDLLDNLRAIYGSPDTASKASRDTVSIDEEMNVDTRGLPGGTSRVMGGQPRS